MYPEQEERDRKGTETKPHTLKFQIRTTPSKVSPLGTNPPKLKARKWAYRQRPFAAKAPLTSCTGKRRSDTLRVIELLVCANAYSHADEQN